MKPASQSGAGGATVRAWPAYGASTRVLFRGLPLRLAERRLILLLGDVLLLLAAGIGSVAIWVALRRDVTLNGGFLASQAPWLIGLSTAWLLLWAANQGYDLRIAASVRQTSRRLLATALIFALLYLLLFFMTSIPPILLHGVYGAVPGLGSLRPLRVMPALFVVLALAAEMAWRNSYARVLTGERFRRRTIVVGAGRSGHAIARALRDHDDGTYRVIGFVDDDPAKLGQEVILGARGRPVGRPLRQMHGASEGLHVLGDRHGLKELIAREHISTLVMAITHEVDGDMIPALLECLELGVEIVPMPVLYEELTGRVPVEHVGDNWYVAMPIQHPSTGSLYPIFRRAMDIALSSLGLILLGLALPGIAVAIWLDSSGPIFYAQERVGKGGRVFRAYKFRSMVLDAEKGGAVWAQRNDDRVTRVGRFLRRAHVDEFPQFLNILKGEMSVVGPRPERPEILEELVSEIPFYRARHAVKPGMAGWALIRQGYVDTKEAALLRLQYDLYYIKHQSPWLDLIILVRTIVDTLAFRGR